MRRILHAATITVAALARVSAADAILMQTAQVDGKGHWTAEVALPAEAAGATVLVVVQERGVNVRLSVAGSAPRATAVEVDSPVDRSGLLAVALPALQSRGASLRVRVLGEEPSGYRGAFDIEARALSDADQQSWAEFTSAGERYARANAMRSPARAATDDLKKLLQDAAQDYADAAAAAKRSGDRRLAAQATLHRAFLSYSELGDKALSMSLADEAASALREAGDEYGAARATSLGAAARRDSAGDSRRDSITISMPPQIAAKFAAAETMFRNVERYHEARHQRYEQAQAVNNLGLTYSLQGRYEEGLEHYGRAVELFKQIDHSSNAARSIQNSALVQFELGNHRACEAGYAAALRTLQREDDQQLYGDILNNAGLCLHVKGELDRALSYYEEAFRVQTQLGNTTQTARTLHGMASTYYAMGDRDTALELYRQALARRPPGRGRAATLSTLGNLSCAAGRYADAVGYYSEALTHSVLPMVNRRIQLRLARCLTLDDRLADATVYLAEVERSLGGSENVAGGLLLLEQGRVALARKNWTQARAKLEASLPQLAKYEFIEEQSEALALLGSGAAALGSPDLAMRYADDGIRLAEQIRGRSRNPELRATLFAPWRKFYDLKIALLLRPYLDGASGPVPAEAAKLALQAADQSRFRALEEIQQEPRAGIEAASGSERRQVLLELTQKRAQVMDRIERSGAEDERAQRLLRDIAGLRTRLDTLAASATPAISGKRPPASDPLTVAIPSDTAVVSYWVGESSAVAWVQTEQGVWSYSLGAASRVDALAQQAHSALATLDRPRETLDAALRAASDALLAPLTQLREKRKWIIVADGALHSLPFAPLPLPGSNVPVIARHELAMAPALRLLRARNPSRSRIGSALLVADPVFESSDERMPRGAARSQVLPLNLQFPRLQATGTEIARIEQHLAGARIQRLTGFDASRDALLASLQTPVDLLHLATHSRVDPDFPQLSAIVLSRYDQAGRERVPWVYAADLRSLPLTGSYVVMSACEGALGKRVEGEGLIGLSYALLGAGTRGVVAATWRVADAATASYMDAFYESLREQADLPRAAAHAARRMLKDRQWSHPNHWAAFAALESEM